MEENYQLNIPKSVGTYLSKREKVSTLIFVVAFYVGTPKNFALFKVILLQRRYWGETHILGDTSHRICEVVKYAVDILKFQEPQENYSTLNLSGFKPMGYVIIIKNCRVSLH